MSATRIILRNINPLRPYIEIAKSAGSLASTIVDTKDAVKKVHNDAVNKRHKEVSPLTQKARTIRSDKQRFEFLYQQNGWTEDNLEKKLKAILNTQLVYFCLLILISSVGAGILLFVEQSPIFFTMNSVIFMLGAASLGALTINEGLSKMQIRERELFNIQTRFGRKGFFFNALLPF